MLHLRPIDLQQLKEAREPRQQILARGHEKRCEGQEPPGLIAVGKALVLESLLWETLV